VQINTQAGLCGRISCIEKFCWYFCCYRSVTQEVLLMPLMDMKCRNAKPWPALGARAALDEFLHLRKLISN